MVTNPYPGVLHRSEDSGGQRFHVVEVALARPSLALHVSAETNRHQTVSSIGKAERAIVAVNASFFRPDDSLCGIAVARGATWAHVDDTTCIHGMAWGPPTVGSAASWQLLSTSGLAKGPFSSTTTDVVSGYPTLVKGGRLCDGSTSACAIPSSASTAFLGPNPRTMLGVDAARSKVFLVVVDGRQAGADGLSLVDTMKLMRDLGAVDAVNLDGGGSTTLWIENEGGVQNKPSDGSERIVSSALVLLHDPSKESASVVPAASAPAPRTVPTSAVVAAAVSLALSLVVLILIVRAVTARK